VRSLAEKRNEAVGKSEERSRRPGSSNGMKSEITIG